MASSIRTAYAADTFLTGARVNLRAEASLESGVIKTLNAGVSVEVLEYDPANWSKVSTGGVTGYIKSEYLVKAGQNGQETRPADSVKYITTSRVNFRTGPSLDAAVIKSLNTGTAIQVSEYDPVGWAKADIEGVTGYIKSEYLVETGQNGQDNTAEPEDSVHYRTTDRVNFRTEPSLDAAVIKLLNAGTAVQVLEYDPENWSKVSVNGNAGYIKSEYLMNADSYAGGTVELLEWSYVKTIFKTYVPTQVLDVRTGLTYFVQSFSNGNHADVEPLTKEDTEILKRTYGGKWSWDPRPVWVTINGRTIAASINGMPHGGGTIAGNGMNGQVCLHFLGSTTHNGNKSFEKRHQDGVIEAWNAG
jgi:uncharacterized protein YgiM (DUF1202 family)